MKALTLHPLMAWAVIHGGKNVENRSWPTHHRGTLAIHASANEDPDTMAEFIDYLEGMGVEIPEEIEVSAIIGTVELVRISEPPRDDAGPWADPGSQYHWHLEDAKPCKSVEIKGALRLWEVPSNVKIETVKR